MLQYVLRFVAGKDQGREFPLPQDLYIVIGRVSDVDVLLLDEKVSRKHAKISTHGGKVMIEDLASRNGTFVNGARIRNTELKEGDQIIIGSSTIRLVSVKEPKPRATPTSAAPAGAHIPEGLPAVAGSALISGSIHEMPLPDLLQLFTNSRKSGVMTIRSDRGVGKLYLREGQVYHAEIESNPVVKSRKAFYRMFGWNDGTFDLRPAGDHRVPEEITESTTSLILEGVRQLDEIRILEPKLPRAGARLHVAEPLPGNLRDLATEEIQLFQLVLHHNTLETAVDNFPGTDFEAYTCLMDLLRRGFITSG
jgi:pSer/pThr/pTyr-binding forkhead associated (FHA) protein